MSLHLKSPVSFSSSPPGSSSKSDVKKKQQECKAVVGTMCKLIQNWNHDVQQIQALLGTVGNLMSTMGAVQRLQNRTPKNMPLFDELFPDAYGLLLGNMSMEVEATYHLLKQHLTGLGDVIAAMHMVSEESAGIVTNELVHVFDTNDIIYTVDHLLEIQQLTAQYTLEHERKRDLILHRVLVDTVGDEDKKDMSVASVNVLAVAGIWPDNGQKGTTNQDVRGILDMELGMYCCIRIAYLCKAKATMPRMKPSRGSS